VFHHNEAGVVFELTIRRKPLNVILTVVIPIAMLSILNICVFVLPCESGERAGYAITVFLAFAVFMTIISSSLPEKSDSVSLFSIYLVIQLACSTLITIIALVLINFQFKDDNCDTVPRWLVVMLLALTFKRQKKPTQVHVDTVVEMNEEDGVWDDMKRETNPSTLTWKESMKIFDKIFFIFFLAIFILSSILTFAITAAW